MNLSLILFTIGILGFVLNRKNIILMLISIEIMLLAITFLVLVSSLSFDDILGQTYAIYIIAIAGAESAIGLGILVAFYRFISLKSIHLSFSQPKSPIKALNIIPSGIRNYSTSKPLNSVWTPSLSERGGPKNSLDPLFITGIFDAESSFLIAMLNNSRYKTGWNVQARIQLKMHEKDRSLVLKIQEYFGGIGLVSKPNNNSTVEFRVHSIKDITNVIIPHFDNYPLLTKKYSDYMLFKNVINLMLEKQHTNLEGIQKIINTRASMNWGLSDQLKKAFPDTIPVIREERVNNYNTLVHSKLWIAGFSTGESNFFIAINKSKTTDNIYASLRFSIAQDLRDVALLESFVNFFKCGYVVRYEKRSIAEFVVTRIDDIVNHVIPLFEEHNIAGSKYSNYCSFKRAALMVKNKEHLKENGLKEVLLLKDKMGMKPKNNHGDD
jgi:NADH:ubiquinone oxidoreductase subunit K